MPLQADYPVRTARLLLRPYVSDDLGGFFDVYQRADVARYLHWEPFSRSQAEEHLQRRLTQDSLAQEGDRLTLAVCSAANERYLGEVTLRWVSEPHRQGEIGFVLHPDHHGEGFATEAATAMLGFGFDLLGLHRIFGRCDPRNMASIRVLRRLGMRQEALFRQNHLVKGSWSSEVILALLENEWRGASSKEGT